MDSNCPPVRLTALIPYLLIGLILKLIVWGCMFFKAFTLLEVSLLSFHASWIVGPWLCLYFLRPIPQISWPSLRTGTAAWTLSYISLSLLYQEPILQTFFFSPKILTLSVFFHALFSLLAVVPCWLSIEAMLRGRTHWLQQLLVLEIMIWVLPVEGAFDHLFLCIYLLLKRFGMKACSLLIGIQMAAALFGSEAIWERRFSGFFMQANPPPTALLYGLTSCVLVLSHLFEKWIRRKKVAPTKQTSIAKLPEIDTPPTEGNLLS